MYGLGMYSEYKLFYTDRVKIRRKGGKNKQKNEFQTKRQAEFVNWSQKQAEHPDSRQRLNPEMGEIQTWVQAVKAGNQYDINSKNNRQKTYSTFKAITKSGWNDT